MKALLPLLLIITLSQAAEMMPRASYYKDGEIHITVLGQPETKAITTGHWDFKPSWSITGDHLVFFRRLKDDPDVNNWITAMCIINTDGTGFHQLSDGTFTDFNPTWTRDGKNTPVWNRKVPGKLSYHIMASKIGGKPGEEIQLTDPSYHAWVHSAVRDGRLFVSATLPKLGRVSRMEDAVDRYVAHAVASMGGVRLDGMRVALDNAHGASSYTSALALEQLGADVQVFHSEPDGFNINEECGCTHSEELERLVRQSQAQAGIAHDGDADRSALCDEEAIALDGDELMAIAAESMLRKGTLKENSLAVTIMSNYGLDDLVSRLGGRVIRTNVGDRYVLEEMHARGLNFGGEQSGHIIFGDWATTGDGLIAGLQILKIMKETGEPLSQLRKCLKKFPQSSRNLRVRSKPPMEELKDAQKIIQETEKKLGDYGRVLLRYSGTESLIRLLIEGRDVEYLEAQADKIASSILAQIG